MVNKMSKGFMSQMTRPEEGERGLGASHRRGGTGRASYRRPPAGSHLRNFPEGKRGASATSKAPGAERKVESMRDKGAKRAANRKLHIDDGCMGGGGSKINYEKSTTFDEFDDIKKDYFDWNKRGKVFHYCLFCKDTRDSKGTHWGIAEKLNINGTTSYNPNYHGTGKESKDADDFMVKSEEGKFLNPDKAERQAGVFMHELGHNLGLMLDRDNDGWEDQDRLKSNPKTCMNYRWIIYHVDYTSAEWNSIMPAGIQYAEEGK